MISYSLILQKSDLLASLYFHIPFCKQRCSYCDFHFSTNLSNTDEMVNAIIHEIKLRKSEIKTPIETIYFGGGTPSLLTLNQLNRIFGTLQENFDLASVSEITLEANPDDLTDSKLKEFRQTPINRLSIGVQSFFDEDLILMNRAHRGSEAENCIKFAQNIGFDNITIDLIYGSSSTTHEMWHQNLQKAVDLAVPHISSYALTVEPKTKLDFDIQQGKIENIDEDVQFLQFKYLQNFLKSNQYIQYEISNFGKKGAFAVHNSNYWKSKKYYGFGPSAHSFDGENRKWNMANNAKYIKNIMQNILPFDLEVLSEKDKYNEMIMIALRTIWGVDENVLKLNFSDKILTEFQKVKLQLLKEELLIQEGNFVKIPESKKVYTDGITSKLFYV